MVEFKRYVTHTTKTSFSWEHTQMGKERVRHNKPFGFGRSLLESLIKIGWHHGFLRLLFVYRQRQALFAVCLRVWKFLSFLHSRFGFCHGFQIGNIPHRLL